MVCRLAAFVLPLFLTLTSATAAERDPAHARLTEGVVPSVSFGRDVIPALTKAGCNSGACHGSFQGRGGFQLSLLGFDAAADYDALTKAGRGRRINSAAPETSLILQKATGVAPHGGGRRIVSDSEVAEILRVWLTSGRPGPTAADLHGLRLSVEPREALLSPDAQLPLQVTATFGDGSTRNVTPWALFDAREKLIAEVSRTGVITALKPGRTAVTVRYLGQVATVNVSVPYGPSARIDFTPLNFIDEIVVKEWERMGVQPAAVVDDATFLRRVSLDLIGTLPTVDEARAFLEDASPDKRTRLIDALLQRPEYVDYWSLRWGDLLRAHRRYLGDKGLASFSGWIRQSIRENKPLDVLTRELLTAQGNLFTNGPVAYYFIDEKVEDLAETTAQVFLGVRLQCTKCHHHPNEVWSQDDYYGLAAYFSRLEAKDSGAQGAKFGGPKSIRPIAKENPNRRPQIAAAMRVFGETSAPTPEGEDPRQHLAAWMTRPENQFFAKNFANRYWAWLMGRGLVEPVDDLRDTNPASIPALHDALATEFTRSGYDAKHLLRTICRSQVYQLSAELNPQRDLDGQLATHRLLRRLPAEVLLDAVNQVTGATEAFPGQPPGTRAVALPDPTIASSFLTTFGRPLRNNPCECARGGAPDLAQALLLANGEALHGKITTENGRLQKLIAAGKTDAEIAEEVYLAALSRRPTPAEQQAIRESVAEVELRNVVWQDVLWAVLNCSEFVFQH